MNNSRLQRLVDTFAYIAISSLAIGYSSYLSNPTAVIAATSTGILLRNTISDIGEDIISRTLSKREKERVSLTFLLTLSKIESNIKEGRTIRNDDFFDDSITNRSAAKEILEGMLMISQKEFEEKKLKFIANLLGNIVFDERIDRFKANWLLKITEKLSYTQLCIIYYVFERKTIFFNWESNYTRRESDISILDIQANIDEVLSMNIIFGRKGAWKTDMIGSNNFSNELTEILNLSEIDPCDIEYINLRLEKYIKEQ